MEEKFDKAIDNVLAMAARPTCKPEEAMKLTQSVLNLAHARATLAALENELPGKRPLKPKGPDS